MPASTNRRKRRTPEEMIADLEAEIAAVKQRAASPNRRPREAKRSPRRRTLAPGIEDLLRAAAAELGLPRAIAILNEQRQALRSVGIGATSTPDLVPEPAPYEIKPAAPKLSRGRPRSSATDLSLDAYERMAIQRAIAESGGEVAGAVALLKSNKSTIYRRMKLLGIPSPAWNGMVAALPDDPVAAAGTPVSFEAYERAALTRALDAANGSILDAATRLGLSKSSMYRRVRALGMGLAMVS